MPPKRSVVIAQSIVREIRDRRLQPGSQLPPEHEMLRTYNVGRNTLREALRLLELQGVLTIRPEPGGAGDPTKVEVAMCQHMDDTRGVLREVVPSGDGSSPELGLVWCVKPGGLDRCGGRSFASPL